MTLKASVKLDKNSGEIRGWDTIWAILELEEKKKNEIKQVGKQYSENVQKLLGNLPLESGIEEERKSQLSSSVIVTRWSEESQNDGNSKLIQNVVIDEKYFRDINGYIAVQEDNTNFILKHKDCGDYEEVKVQLIEDENG